MIMFGGRKFKAFIGAVTAAVTLGAMLGGCGVIQDNKAPGRSIPESTLAAPDTEYTGKVQKVAIYFLNKSGTLTAEVRTVVIGQDTNPATVAIQELLKGPSNGETLAGVAPAGMNLESIEYSRDVVNVYLSYGGPAMDAKSRYTLELAIADTVTDVLGASYISVFYNGIHSGFYPGIPYGPLEKQTGAVDDLWNAASAKYSDTPAVPGEEEPGAAEPSPSPSPSVTPTPLPGEELSPSPTLAPKVKTISTVLYFVSSDGGFLLPEVREVKYTDGDYLSSIIAELAKGPQNAPAMESPVKGDLVLDSSSLEKMGDGTYKLTLDFNSKPEKESSVALGTLLPYASIVYSITGLIPDISSIQMYAAGKKISAGGFVKNDFKRSDYKGYIGSSAPIYFADKGSDLLLQVSRSMEQGQIWSARERVLELIKGPLPGDGGDAWPVMPESIIYDDVKSVTVYSDTAYVDLSQHFADSCKGLSSKSEMLLVYAIVNTVTSMDGINKVQFLVEGKQVQTLSGSLCLTDPFLRNYGIVKQTS